MTLLLTTPVNNW